MRRLLRVSDLSGADLTRLLSASGRRGPRRLLAGRSVVFWSNGPSSPYRLAFETAAARLHAAPVGFDPGFVPGDEVTDLARVASAAADCLVVEVVAERQLERIARASAAPVVNAGSDLHRPLEGLALVATVLRRLGHLDGLKLAYLGAAGPTLHSLMEACALAGIDLAVATPPGFGPDPEVVGTAERLADRSGSGLLLTHDPYLAALDADAVGTDGWPAPAPFEDPVARRRALAPYRVDAAVMALAAPHAVFLHPLPAVRGEEVATEVVDGPAGAPDHPATRVAMAAAILAAIVTGSLTGSPDGENAVTTAGGAAGGG